MAGEPLIKIHGYYRSGTNWLAEVIRQNIPDAIVMERLVLGSKHEPAANAAKWRDAIVAGHETPSELTQAQMDEVASRIDEIQYVVVTKDPVAQVDSLFRWKGPNDREAAQNHAWQSSLVHAEWKSQADALPARWLKCRYEDLLESTVPMLQELATRTGATFDPENVMTVDSVVMPNGVTEKPFEKKAYYLEKQYMDRFTPSMVLWIALATNWTVMESFGYTRPEGT